jgi:hypothetical protein
VALSNSYNFATTAAEVIQGALEKIHVVIAGESVDSDDQALGLRELNKLVKQWSHPADGAPGMKTWLRKTLYLFFAEGAREYAIGPSQDRATETLGRVLLGADEAAGQTTITLATAGPANSDIIGIAQSDGTLHWSTVSSGGGTTTIVIGAATTVDAVSGATVFYFTPVTGAGNSVPYRPLEVISATLRKWDSSGNPDDVPVDVYYREERREFEYVSRKSAMSDPTAVLIEVMRTFTRVTLDQSAKNVTKVLRMVVTAPADDLDNATDDLNFPIEWSSALEWELAKRLAPTFRAGWNNEQESSWTQATGIARSANPRGYVGGFIADEGLEDCGTL